MFFPGLLNQALIFGPLYLPLHFSILARILLSHFNQNSSSPISDYCKYWIGFLILHHSPSDILSPWSIFRKNSLKSVYPESPLHLTFSLSNFPPSNTFPLCSFTINSHLTMLYSELNSVLYLKGTSEPKAMAG